jgi:thiol-disulfide isomerase/thioredoxin
MKSLATNLAGLALLITGLGVQPAAADALDGRWDATITLNEVVIPFRLDIAGDGPHVTGTLFNGDIPQTTTRASRDRGTLVLDFEHYLTKITATETNGELGGTVEGRFQREPYIAAYPFHAQRHVARAPASGGDVPSIDGLWEIEHESPKGEKAWRFVVQQHGDEASAAVLRVDGDTGALTGRYQDGTFVLSHFDGARPLLYRVTPRQDGTLEIRQAGAYATPEPLIAYRPKEARAKGLPEPADFLSHTRVRDPNEIFTFRFPDVDGKIVSNEDPAFKNKVVIVTITGTWCPNCHDETPYLVELYRRYHDQGLEIVALDFEEAEQRESLARVRAFRKKYGVAFTYLIAGAPADLPEKVPQAVNLNTWPATFFIGRDGRVKTVHAGFAAPASGAFNGELRTQFTSTIERLLAEGTTTRTAPRRSVQ